MVTCELKMVNSDLLVMIIAEFLLKCAPHPCAIVSERPDAADLADYFPPKRSIRCVEGYLHTSQTLTGLSLHIFNFSGSAAAAVALHTIFRAFSPAWGVAVLGPGWKVLKHPESCCRFGCFTARCMLYPRGQTGSRAFSY